MGKASRLRDRRSANHIKVDDAAAVIAGLQSWATQPRQTGPRGEWMRDVARFTFDRWVDSPVVLRVDGEFAGALLNSNTDVDLVPDWLDRFPFNSIAYSLASPISLHDGHRLCHYLGMIVTGINNVRYNRLGAPPPIIRSDGREVRTADGSMFTRYVNIPSAQGVRCLWVFKEERDPTPQLQSVSFQLRGANATDTTLSGLIAAQIEISKEVGQSGGEELPVLIPLSLSLLLYSAGQDPEIEWPPPTQISRPQQIRDSKIGNLGWRIGATLRQQSRSLASQGESEGTVGLGGWRLPPHIRKAHWHRVRIVERDEAGHPTGRRDGAEGVDWHYELRWYPPTPVNASSGVAPAVRDP